MIPLSNMEQASSRQAHHGNLVAFRAGDRLVAAIAQQARRSGCSVSEYLRTVVREKVGLD
jgi:hypothetical protein